MFPAFSLLLYFLFTFNFNAKSISSTLGNQTDHLSLLKFKESITSDPHRMLDSWNGSIHFCNWHGITCIKELQR
ncbi:putative non-specific serine/threonine protein kinase [Medicago truncatula]|uniref:Putative non-specific serine/threonine protein kinase n=1 Tax=Medicago truncatula TaxID=3880 RepID=A0A396HPZ3_MEDTR|nr:putative non-specific serine/threonine protein kinase [Medicago truncatula]